MKIKIWFVLSIVLALGLSACSSGEDVDLETTSLSTFADTNEDGVQDIQLSYGKVGYSFNYLFSSDTVQVGEPVRIIADVDSLKGCYRYIQVPQYDISKYVTDSDNSIEFTPTETGEILFTCSMGMGTAKLTVI